MQNIERLEKKQYELDEERAPCPQCGRETRWGELRELGCCVRCYTKAIAKNVKSKK
jgi:hypothetical protein